MTHSKTSPSGGPQTSGGPDHFDAEELLAVLEHGFECPERRQDAWLHFATGCTTCRRAARDLDGREDLFDPPPSSWDTVDADPLVVTLADLCVASRRREPSLWLFPWHRVTIHRIDEEPVAFARAYLERRHFFGGQQEPRIAAEGSEEAVEAIKSLGAAVEDDRSLKAQVDDLLVLALSYLAENLAACFAFSKAEPVLRQAERLLGPCQAAAEKRAGNAESRASYSSARSELFRRRGQIAKAISCLESAMEVADGVALPGLQALVWIRLSILLTRMGHTREAIALLRKALEETPASLSIRFHLEISHRLAVAYFHQQDFTVVLEILAQMDELYRDENTPDLLRVQRAWLEGASRLQSEAADPSAAEPWIREAFEGYLRLGLPDGGANALQGLYQVKLLAGRCDEPPEDLLRYLSILRGPDEVGLILEVFHSLRLQASVLGIVPQPFDEEIRILEAQIRALEDEKQVRIVH